MNSTLMPLTESAASFVALACGPCEPRPFAFPPDMVQVKVPRVISVHAGEECVPMRQTHAIALFRRSQPTLLLPIEIAPIALERPLLAVFILCSQTKVQFVVRIHVAAADNRQQRDSIEIAASLLTLLPQHGWPC